LWRYKRGAALVAMKQFDPALNDLQIAATPSAQGWVHGRARVELARMALQKGNRQAAAVEARQAQSLCEKGNDPVCLEAARKLLRDANGR
jgi:hypothetical protein